MHFGEAGGIEEATRTERARLLIADDQALVRGASGPCALAKLAKRAMKEAHGYTLDKGYDRSQQYLPYSSKY